MFELKIDRLQRHFSLPSYAAVIQTALGLLYNLIQVAENKGAIWIEGTDGSRPMSPFILIGHINKDNAANDSNVKYQIMLSDEQQFKLDKLIMQLAATSAAEIVRYALRVLESVSLEIGEKECIVVSYGNGREAVLEI